MQPQTDFKTVENACRVVVFADYHFPNSIITHKFDISNEFGL